MRTSCHERSFDGCDQTNIAVAAGAMREAVTFTAAADYSRRQLDQWSAVVGAKQMFLGDTPSVAQVTHQTHTTAVVSALLIYACGVPPATVAIEELCAWSSCLSSSGLSSPWAPRLRCCCTSSSVHDQVYTRVDDESNEINRCDRLECRSCGTLSVNLLALFNL